MAEDPAVRSVVERERVAEVINRLFVATDARDWEQVQTCFAPQVAFDMTSLAGGDFHLVRGEQWKIDLLRFNLKFIDGNLDLDKEPSV